MTTEEKFKIAIEKGITYNPETGKVFGVKGKEIGSINDKGYYHFNIKVDKKIYLLTFHRFGWYFVYGQLPEVIDHINQNKLDNRIDNLRIVTRQENQFNTKAKGYFFDKNRRKFTAQITIDRKNINLGRFNTEDEAKAAYLAAKEKYHIINERD